MAKFFLGIDGGGTYTKAAMVDENGKLISQNQSAGSNVNVFGLQSAAANLNETIRQAIGDIKGEIFGCLAISGVNFPKDKESWQKTVANDPFLKSVFFKPPLVVNDALAALRSGTTDKNALVIIAGTGSNCYGRNERGEEAKAGGVDYILSDEGGGYWIGLEILQRVTKSLDGRGQKTKLTELLFSKLNVNSLERLYETIYQKPWGKFEIAQIASLAEEASKNGDFEANEIINSAAIELSLMVKAVVKKLGLESNKFTVVKAGSILKIKRLICERVEKEILKFAKDANFAEQNIDSANGAAYLAYEAFNN